VNSLEMVEAFKALSSEKRVEIVRLLCRRCRMCAGALARELDISPSSASQHLRVLKYAGLVEDCRCGNNIHYSIDTESITRLSDLTGELLDISQLRENEDCLNNRECEKRRKRGG
jgi:ArsR family transcriptional regulator, arsenate/arsenite/antimonite-responsive transcriptional repressor